MKDFKCDKCGANILEGAGCYNMTGCDRHPQHKINNTTPTPDNETIISRGEAVKVKIAAYRRNALDRCGSAPRWVPLTCVEFSHLKEYNKLTYSLNDYHGWLKELIIYDMEIRVVEERKACNRAPSRLTRILDKITIERLFRQYYPPASKGYCELTESEYGRLDEYLYFSYGSHTRDVVVAEEEIWGVKLNIVADEEIKKCRQEEIIVALLESYDFVEKLADKLQIKRR